MMKRTLPALILCLLLAALFAAGCGAAAAEEPAPVVPAEEAGQSGGEWPAAVIIYLGNQVYQVLPLEDNVVTIDQEEGRVNEITITGQGVRMTHASCEKQECVNQGEVTLENYQTRVMSTYIVCLPNQVTINMVVQEELTQ